jgi:malonyl-ACP O-methyltransferase BioC
MTTGLSPQRARRPEAGDPGSRKSAIARSFDAAAATYDTHAAVQRRAAAALAARIAELPLPPSPRILEIGCGTGFLSAALLCDRPDARCLFTDLSAAMARRCRGKIGARTAAFAVMDGEMPAVSPVFDLVASSFTFQWFLDLEGAMANLAACLRPGGRLVCATLGADSLSEWRSLHKNAGLSFGGLAFPTAAELSRMAARGGLRGAVAEERVERRYRGVPTFLHELKSLGAGTPGPGAALGVPQLRRLLRAAETGGAGFTGRAGFQVTYHVLYGSFTRTGPAP